MVSQIKTFFTDQTIFLTGGTGFLGKVIVEKLLRECQDLKKIFLMIRPKKGKTPEERLRELFDLPCFANLKLKNVNLSEKVYLVYGDCEQPFLGLSNHDLGVLKSETTCVIHAAANVKFDQTFKEAALYVRAARDLLEIAKEMEKLKAFMHVSTFYSNALQSHIKEEFYEPPMAPEFFLSMAENLDENVLNKLTPIILKEWPNIYVYSKNMIEDLVRTVGKNLPISIVRPAIVVSALQEPLPGWIDSFYGVAGIIAAAGLGVVRIIKFKIKAAVYLVPIDYVTNCILAATCQTANSSKLIYNFAGSKQNLITWELLSKNLLLLVHEVPLQKTLWYPSVTITESNIWYRINIFFTHTIPSYIIDFILFCLGKPQIVVKNVKRLHKTIDTVDYFKTREWSFDDDNVTQLWRNMNEEDQKLFCFDMSNIDFPTFVKISALGGRLYLLKEKPETLPKAQKKLKMLFYLHYSLMTVLLFLFCKLLMFVFIQVFEI